METSRAKPNSLLDGQNTCLDFFMNNLQFFIDRYHIDISQEISIIVPGVGRVELAQLFHDLGFQIGAEVGVQRAEYSEVILKHNPDIKFFGIDAWTANDGYRDINGDQDKYTQNYEIAKRRTSSYNCTLIKKWSIDAANDIDDNSLDFVYIDANHDFEHCTQDISSWEKKVRKGGIVSGHDFWRHNGRPKIHVKDVVEAWCKAHEIKPLFAITKDRCPNWMYFKQ